MAAHVFAYAYQGPTTMPNAEHVLLVDDEPHVLASTAQTLELAGFSVSCFENAHRALQSIDRNWPGIVISDLRMPRLDGIELMQKIHARDSDIPFILISGHADIADAVKAIQQGAYDFLEKPYHQGRLVECAKRAQNHRKLVLENRRLSNALDEHTKNIWIGNSLPTQTLRDQLSLAAQMFDPITLQGERGSGKTLAALALHKMSMCSGAFKTIDCRMISEDTNWNELTCKANGGTLVLRHVDRTKTLQLQSLSHMLANETNFSARLIATCRTPLSLKPNSDENIPSSLFYKITRKTIKVPNLQSRAEDIPLLFRHFLDTESRKLGRPAPVFGSSFLAQLMTRDWPDNVRELKGISEEWFARTEGEREIKPEKTTSTQDTTLSLPELVSQFEKQLIRRELEAQGGDIKNTYAALGIPRKTLYDKLSKHGISRESFIAGNLTNSDD